MSKIRTKQKEASANINVFPRLSSISQLSRILFLLSFCKSQGLFSCPPPPLGYSYRQTLRSMIFHPHPIGATAIHGKDLVFILKCLSHHPPFQYSEAGRPRGERVRRSTAVQINECTIGGWVSSTLPVWPTACTNCVWGGTTCMQSICLLPDRRRTENFAQCFTGQKNVRFSYRWSCRLYRLDLIIEPIHPNMHKSKYDLHFRLFLRDCIYEKQWHCELNAVS